MMIKRIARATLLALAVGLVAVQPASAAVGIRIANGRLVEANGTELVLRGINHAHTWYKTQTSSFANIKAAGANSVRVVLSGGRWQPADTAADVANVINLCKQNRLICVLENHDTTGFGEQGGAVSLDAAVNYWISVQSALTGQENYVILNIGNEPFGNNPVTPGWTQATSSAITRLRNAGFQHTIMVDGPNWGQDWQFVMRDNAQTILNADSQRNTVLSIHMYAVFNTAASIVDYLNRFQTNGWPLVIGEFGWRFNSGEVDHDTILAEAQARGLGYLGWSWSGNTDPILDMATNFNPAQLTTWGERIFNGVNGIKATAREATVFGGTPTTPVTTPPVTTPPVTTPPVTTPPVTTPPPGTRTCTATYAIVGQWPGGFQGDVRVTAGSSAISGWTVTWTFANGQTVNQAWSATVTSSGSSVTARNMSYNGALGGGASTGFGFIGSWNGSNGAPALSCTAS
jgi:mannan endo-1,4-beta-mannosidase